MIKNTNSKLSTIHTNNFDFLRLSFALLVLVTHSYLLSGLPEQDILFQFSHGQASLSHLGIQGFLIISGFLITKSLLRSQTLYDYYYKRALRVFPGLWFLLFVSAGICFFFNNKNLIEYLTHYSTRDYIFYNALLKTQYNIGEVFEKNPYPNAINGSLWTIPYEFFFYIILSVSFSVRTHIRTLRWGFIVLFIILATLFLIDLPNLKEIQLPFWQLQGSHIAELGAFFTAGTIWAVLPQPAVKTRQLLPVLSLLLLLSSMFLLGYIYVQFLALPIFVISFGSLNSPIFSRLNKYGDFSYGIYLWGFFVQQTLMHLFHLNLLELMITSIMVTYCCGALSWHLVEKQALRLKLKLEPKAVNLQ
jgi:peptidoglycan/LPS O-acetylase OafA/YrhL